MEHYLHIIKKFVEQNWTYILFAILFLYNLISFISNIQSPSANSRTNIAIHTVILIILIVIAVFYVSAGGHSLIMPKEYNFPG